MGQRDNLYDREARCPFYHGTRGLTVICEGPFAGSSLALTMRSRRLFERQLKTFCCDQYERCEVCRLVRQQYEDD